MHYFSKTIILFASFLACKLSPTSPKSLTSFHASPAFFGSNFPSNPQKFRSEIWKSLSNRRKFFWHHLRFQLSFFYVRLRSQDTACPKSRNIMLGNISSVAIYDLQVTSLLFMKYTQKSINFEVSINFMIQNNIIKRPYLIANKQFLLL